MSQHPLNKYKVNIGGENFIVHLEGEKRRINLVRSYYLTAINEESAEHQALNELKKELTNLVLNDIKDPPEMYVQSVEVVVGHFPETNPSEFYWNEINNDKN